jgi:hypothetical protein
MMLLLRGCGSDGTGDCVGSCDGRTDACDCVLDGTCSDFEEIWMDVDEDEIDALDDVVAADDFELDDVSAAFLEM